MSQPTLGDIPIWMINLPRSVERATRMRTQLDGLGLTFRHFDAVDGRARWDDLKDTVDIPAFERNVGRPVMPGEIGCYHSHLGVWQAFLDTDAPAALVLEDDVVFHDDFRPAVDAALTRLGDWDMVKLNHIRAKWPVQKIDLGQWQCAAYIGPFTGTGAYLINRNIVAQLLADFRPITRPIDHELDRSHVHRLRHYGLLPYPSHVADAGQSTITGSNFAGVAKFAKHKRLPAYANRWRNLIGKARYAAFGGGR